MNISTELKLFIHNNKELINQRKWDDIYTLFKQEASKGHRLGFESGVFTQMLHQCGIYPEQEVRMLPPGFFSSRDIVMYKIPDNIIYIGPGAFRDCWQLTKLIMPKKIIAIGHEAFQGCFSLEEVIYKGTKQEFSETVWGQSSGIKWPFEDITVVKCTDGELIQNDFDK